MKKVKITTYSSIIAQIPAGVDADVIVADNVVYIPAFSMNGMLADSGDDAPAAAPKAEEKKSAPKAAAKSAVPTEEEMRAMDTNDLLKMCKERGIDPDKTPGKNTHKKLRTLLLESDGGADAPEEEEEAEDASDDSLSVESVSTLLADLEEETISEKEAIQILVKGGIDKKQASEFVKEFLDNPDLELDEHAASLFETEEEEEEEEKPRSRRGKKEEEAPKGKGKGKASAPKKEKIEDFDDLEVGDKLEVKCEDGVFKCEVSDIDDEGNVVIFFPEDDSEDDLDPEFYTEIYRL